ncbi:uncharacterized protein SEPMUDRAFT_146681 [Sphaerulina musiva SO2202]|uniref:Uncharacterized protein n=1 Tax=Sphaerulina musiva (strain SO2202) TaxID=692275 RepID=N1QNF3_SPHMS|nr:uncharacterized protein SEPMUDRAFT_146681 [Sphaerulina musiva SO2202]EMF17708.1 hypothetical protein SEPMUDRAFT_146681 [Sphaerulina musiva SO2202]
MQSNQARYRAVYYSTVSAIFLSFKRTSVRLGWTIMDHMQPGHARRCNVSCIVTVDGIESTRRTLTAV